MQHAMNREQPEVQLINIVPCTDEEKSPSAPSAAAPVPVAAVIKVIKKTITTTTTTTTTTRRSSRGGTADKSPKTMARGSVKSDMASANASDTHMLLETFSTLDFAPEQLSALPVVFAFLKNNRESRRVAMQKQKEFSTQGGRLHLSVADGSVESRPATQYDIDTNPSLIVVEAVFQKKNRKQSVSKPKPAGKRKSSLDAVEVMPTRTKRRATTGSDGALASTPAPKKAKTRAASATPTKKKAAASATPAKKKAAASATPATRRAAASATPATRRAAASATPAKKKAAAPAPASKKKAATAATTPGKSAVEISSIFPPEPEFAKASKGWVRKEFLRTSGATKGGKDKYWYSPKDQIKMRSMTQVRAFMKCLQLTSPKGDEAAAWAMVKQGKGK